MKLAVFFALVCLPVFFSCETVAVFETPNYLRNYPAKLLLVNGRSFEGRLSVEPGRPLGADVWMYEEGISRPMRFRLDEVKGYAANGRYYELKEKRGGWSFGRNFGFMTKLTPDSSRIQLYAEIVNRRVALNNGRMSVNIYDTDLYLQIRGEDPLEVYLLDGSRFTPSFHEKMSRFLSDCPTLAAKIKAKNPGYTLQTSRQLRGENFPTVLRIINEYNHCR